MQPLALTPELLDAIIDHRSILFLLPIVLLVTALFIVWVYGGRLGDTHARDYRAAVLCSVGIAIVSLALVAVESIV